MGMYDEIRIEQILPGNTEITDEWYQTKSFDNVMTNYVITANGQLYEERWDNEWITDEGYMFKGHLQRIEGSYRREYLTDYHGDIIFYGSEPTNVGARSVSRDYYARFTDGKLAKIWYKDTQY